jgi:hypothetical protein
MSRDGALSPQRTLRRLRAGVDASRCFFVAAEALDPAIKIAPWRRDGALRLIVQERKTSASPECACGACPVDCGKSGLKRFKSSCRLMPRSRRAPRVRPLSNGLKRSPCRQSRVQGSTARNGRACPPKAAMEHGEPLRARASLGVPLSATVGQTHRGRLRSTSESRAWFSWSALRPRRRPCRRASGKLRH